MLSTFTVPSNRISNYTNDGTHESFQLEPSFLHSYHGRKPKFGFNGLGEFVFYRTYSRSLPDGRKETFTNTLERVVNGCYEIQRRHCRQIHVPWDYDKAQVSAQEMFRLMWDFKFLPPGRGLWMMGTPFMWERGSAALNNCFAYSTRVITRQGTKNIGDLVNTTVELLTHGGKWVQAPVLSFGAQQLYSLKLERLNDIKEVLTTANHRWFVQSRSDRVHGKGYRDATTISLRPGDWLQDEYISADLRLDSFGVAHGIAFGDGTTGCDAESCGTYLYLCGQKNKELIRFFPNNYHTPDIVKDAIRVADLPRFFRRLPDLNETENYLYGWLAGYFAADGAINPDGTAPAIWSKQRPHLEFVKDVCHILGIASYAINEAEQTVTYNDGTIKKFRGFKLTLSGAHLKPEFFLLEEHRRRFETRKTDTVFRWKVKSVEATGEVAEVFCPQVPETHSFALADNILTGNCGYVSTGDIDVDPAEPFCFLMDMSMVGVGVGFDTRGAGKLQIVAPAYNPNTYVIPDSREGWVHSLRLLIRSYTLDAHKGFWLFDPSQIRPAGSDIRGFGGKASGPAILLELLECVRDLLERRKGRVLSSVDIADIMNLIGKCIVAGNVRRTSEISFGEPEDHAYCEMKNPKASLHPDDIDIWTAVTNRLFTTRTPLAATQDDFKASEVQRECLFALNGPAFSLNGSYDRVMRMSDHELTIPQDRLLPAIDTWNNLQHHRWASNNSLYARVGMKYDRPAENIAVNGEPGFIWLANIQDYGRMIDGCQPGIDGGALGCNPCAEQSLESYELCCLCETFPSHHSTPEDYMRTLKFAYLYAKTVTLLPTHNPRTNSVMQRNRRIGLSQSGIVQAFQKFGRRKVLTDFCDRGFKEIGRWDDIYSRWLCVTRSLKKTSVKPSGTVSLVAGVTPGIHYPEARAYWRRVRVAKNSTIVRVLERAGYHVEPDLKDPNRTVVVKFAVDDSRVPSVEEVSMWEQVANAADYQRYWADNQVSCTIKFKPSESGQIKPVLEVFEDRLKGISFLPWYGHGYAQAPYEPCTPEEVVEYNNHIGELDFTEFILEDAIGSTGCDGDSCSLL